MTFHYEVSVSRHLAQTILFNSLTYETIASVLQENEV